MFSMVISVISEVISVDFGDFGESCYPRNPDMAEFLLFFHILLHMHEYQSLSDPPFRVCYNGCVGVSWEWGSSVLYILL